MIIHTDNAALHVAKCVTDNMDHISLKRALHPPNSPDLASSDFYLSGYVKHQLQRYKFTKEADLVSAISEIWNRIPTDILVDVLTKLRS
jgi:hypothetical protein